MEEVNKYLEEVVSCVKDSIEYKNCISLKEKMKSNEEINSLVDSIKNNQKEYVKSGDKELLEKLNHLEEKLQSIPIYYVYQENLEVVNEKINYIRESLNDYFDDLFNEKY